MTNESGFNWKYLIPVYGLFIIGKSQSTSKNKLILLNLFVSFIIVGIIGGAGDDSSTTAGVNENKQLTEQATGQTVDENASEVKNSWKIGESIKTEKFDLKVNSVTVRSSVGGSYMNEKAADGAVFVIVNFSYKNITKEPISSFSVPDVNVIDPNGTKYDEASGATGFYQVEINLNKKAISDINPGITQKDATVFEVSKDLWKSKGWKLVVDADEDIEILIK
jgi:hypothetical protein